jgi:hypothetical protein
MPMPRDIVPDGELLRLLAAGDPVALASWRAMQQQAAAEPGRAHEPDYVVESRAATPNTDAWRVCPGCGLSKALRAGQPMCPPCRDRGQLPQPAGTGGLRGADALRQLEEPDDQSERKAVAYVETRTRLSAGDVRDADGALAWLADHVTVRHEYR